MRNMSENYKDTLIAVLLVGIVAMTIIYANFTHYLNVRAQSDSNSYKWDIHFENLVNRTSNQDNNTAVINRIPSILTGKTEISSFAVTLNKPGDKVIYTFDIVNKGEFDARLDNYVVSNPQCSGSTSFCDNIIFDFKYTDGTKINQNDILKKGERINVTMSLSIDNSVTSMPSTKVDITNLTGVFYYVQK